MYRDFFLSFPPPPPFCERKKKKRERRKERQESSALETLFVSFLNYYVTCKRSGGVGSGLGESARIDVPHEQPWSLFAISIDRLSRFLPLETLEFRLPRKISHRGCIAKSLASPLDETSNLGSVSRRKRTSAICPFHDTRHGRADLICRSFLSVTFPSRI